MISLRDETGLTIVELSIALTITAVLSTIIIGFSVDKLQQSSLQTMQYELLTNAENGLNTITNDIRLATSADDNNRWQDANSPGAPSNELSWQSDGDTLVLATAAQDSSGAIIFDDVHDYVSAKNNVVYYLSGGSLYRRILADPVSGNSAMTTCPASLVTANCPGDKDVLDNVNSFSVQYFNGQNQQVDPAAAHSVQLTVLLKQHKYNQDITANYTTRMVFRNG